MWERKRETAKKKGGKALGVSVCLCVCVGVRMRNDTVPDSRKKKRASQEDGRSIPPPSLTTNTPFFPPLSLWLCIAHLCCSLISSHQHFISSSLPLCFKPPHPSPPILCLAHASTLFRGLCEGSEDSAECLEVWVLTVDACGRLVGACPGSVIA